MLSLSLHFLFSSYCETIFSSPIALAKWQAETWGYACCSPVEAIRTLSCLSFFSLLLLLKGPGHPGVIWISQSA